MPYITPDVPQYVAAAPASAQQGVHVIAGSNWLLRARSPETPVSRLPDPKPAEPPAPAKPAGGDGAAGSTAGCSTTATVYFAFDQSEADPAAMVASFGHLPKGCRWSVGGYADPRGSVEYNLELSQARARFVADWLTARGYRIGVVQGFGKTSLVTTDPAEYLFDRRARVDGLPAAAGDLPAR